MLPFQGALVLFNVLTIGVVDKTPVLTLDHLLRRPQKTLVVFLSRLQLAQLKDLGELVSGEESSHKRLCVVHHVEATVSLFVLLVDRYVL